MYSIPFGYFYLNLWFIIWIKIPRNQRFEMILDTFFAIDDKFILIYVIRKVLISFDGIYSNLRWGQKEVYLYAKKVERWNWDKIKTIIITINNLFIQRHFVAVWLILN